MRQPTAPANATRTRPSPRLVPGRSLPLASIIPAIGITISLGSGIQQLSIAMARTIPSRPVETYRFVIRVISESVK
jgi:hypothetical protein